MKTTRFTTVDGTIPSDGMLYAVLNAYDISYEKALKFILSDDFHRFRAPSVAERFPDPIVKKYPYIPGRARAGRGGCARSGFV